MATVLLVTLNFKAGRMQLHVHKRLFRHFFTKATTSTSCWRASFLGRPQLAYFVLGMAPVPCMASTLRMARQTAFTEGVSHCMLTTSAHTSLMFIPSSLFRFHARAAAMGCMPRGCSVTCTVGMGPDGGTEKKGRRIVRENWHKASAATQAHQHNEESCFQTFLPRLNWTV